MAVESVEAAAAPLLAAVAPRVKVARASDRVYRDECVFSFDSAFSPDGLYTNLVTLQSFGKPFVALDRFRHELPAVYLHQRHTKVKKNAAEPSASGGEGVDAAPTKLALGGDGGFAVSDADKFDVVERDALVVFDAATGGELAVALDAAVVPPRIREAVEALRQHAGNAVTEEVATWQEERTESKYADHLIQVEHAPKVSSSPASWKCLAPDCDKQENLWLNLSDGYIGCGRRNWDGSGGCGEALRHYEATGSIYPLAVKLGTITAEGGDVYSYAPDEDDIVTDKHLAKHLAHFGINIHNLKKTDKTMDELQVELNLHYEFDAITEAGKKLVAVSGAGLMGFKNLGNSCYMNSVLHVLLSLPEVRRRYLDAAETIFSTCGDVPVDDFPSQFAKLARGVLTDRYKREVATGANGKDPDGKDEAEEEELDLKTIDLRPITFRGLVGKGHPDFSTGQQQDAVEYLQHLMEFMNRSERVASGRIGPLLDPRVDSEKAQLPTSALFQFAFEDRVECLGSGKVKYVPREDSFFQLQIPLEAATNATQVQEYQALEQKRQRTDDGATKSVDEKVVPIVPFQACVEKTLAPETIEDFLSSATGKKGLAQKTVRFKSFPRYLLVQMRRFYVAEDWTPKKLDVVVPVPEHINLSEYLSTGLKSGEELLPEDPKTGSGAGAPSTSAPASFTPDDALVAQLVSMGFSENGCKRAAIATGNVNAEVAMEWIFAHMEDPDFNEPLPPGGGGAAAATGSSSVAGSEFNEEHVVNLTSMGFSEDQVKCALSKTSHNPERAGDWLFNHMDSLDAEVASWKSGKDAAATTSAATGPQQKLDNAVGEYSLVGFVSHIGRNTSSGHYVCHIKKNGRWVIFNDDKVALSEEPPLGAGYLYFFRRNDVSAE